MTVFLFNFNFKVSIGKKIQNPTETFLRIFKMFGFRYRRTLVR